MRDTNVKKKARKQCMLFFYVQHQFIIFINQRTWLLQLCPSKQLCTQISVGLDHDILGFDCIIFYLDFYKWGYRTRTYIELHAADT